MNPIDPAGLVDALLAWHDPASRTLSWRRGTTPYGVLVSEIMAQQTQAERAATAWTAFMARFPTATVLAEAPTSDVIDAWRGLGYNRRALNLQRAATAMVADHRGEVPTELRDLLALPGVGPYTARAVMAFAFDADVIPVDTNVARILARTAGAVLNRPAAQALADELAAVIAPASPPPPPAAAADEGPVHISARSVAAALMDLGATVCTARSPACGACPLLSDCAWAGGPGPDPAAKGAHRPMPQGTFEGSARQARGRLVDALRGGPVDHATALELAGVHGQALIDGLLQDGLADTIDDGLALPGWSGTQRTGTN